jgi:hypothetical protein
MSTDSLVIAGPLAGPHALHREVQMGFAKFMATGLGRSLRMVLGLALIACGLWVVPGTAGKVIAVLGLLAFAAGLFNWCLIAPLIGAPFRGADLK